MHFAKPIEFAVSDDGLIVLQMHEGDYDKGHNLFAVIGCYNGDVIHSEKIFIDDHQQRKRFVEIAVRAYACDGARMLAGLVSLGAELRKILAGARGALNVGPMIGAHGLGDFMDSQFQMPEEILHGLHRGEVGGLMAVTNYGKSTLLYNTALSLAAGEACYPLAPFESGPRRVLYLDFESPAGSLQSDLKTMLQHVGGVEDARRNLALVVDAMVGEDPLCLSRSEHFDRIAEFATAHQSDIVVVDTAASAFELIDENSNAEVTRKILKPLRQLAIEVNCAVVYSHHIGKSSETQTGEAAYRGRGASAFGALSRVIWNLEKDATKGPGYVKVSCSKIKGTAFEPVLLRLDFQSRWFSICTEAPAPDRTAITVQHISDFISGMLRPVSQKEIIEAFSHHSSATIRRRIEEAARIGLIENSGRGKYAVRPICSSAHPIGNEQMSKSNENATENRHNLHAASDLDDDLDGLTFES